MFRRNTVFVVGAGASKELGLPTGAELSNAISDLCDLRVDAWGKPENETTREMLTAMKWAARGDENLITNWMRALGSISDALPYKDSIDAVIDQFHDDPAVAEIGKFMIAKLIMKAEAESLLSVRSGRTSPELRRLKDTWLNTFARMLFEGRRKDSLGDIGENLTIICFNYDRCIELFLVHAIAENYGVSVREALAAAAQIRIIHAYGTLGWLPDWPLPTPQPVVPFGGSEQNPWIVSANLKTFSESVDSSTDEAIKDAVNRGDQYVYLGLSFGRQNMELLGANSHTSTFEERDAYASGLGQHEQGRAPICKLIQRTYSQRVKVPPNRGPHPATRLELNTKAKELLDLHWHNILG